MYDAIVVGARCAGSPLAMLLGRKGYRVLLLGRTGFPSDTISSHLIHLPGVARLQRWGLLDRLRASGCPPISEFRFGTDTVTLAGRPTPCDGIEESYCPRRTILDKLLVDAAVEAGCELREHFTVRDLVSRDGRVTGILGQVDGGSVVEEHARIVVRADGAHSIVARITSPAEYNVYPTRTCYYYNYWEMADNKRLEVHARDGLGFFTAPTHAGMAVLVVGWPRERFETVRNNIEGSYMEALRAVPELADRVAGAHRHERFVGMLEPPNFFRKPYGEGCALVGDAGYHKDAYTGQGITDAFRDAESVADAIDAGLASRMPLNDALAQYERSRINAAKEMYEYTCDLARMEPEPPQVKRLFHALRGNQAETDRFFGVLAGTVRVSEFYAPDNVSRIIAAAGRH
jgi:flavin-dependent dehydrogenase